MARKKRVAPYPAYPDIPDEIWLPFTLALTGTGASDDNAIASLSYIFNVSPEAIKFRLKQELAEEEIRLVHPAHPVLQ